MSGNIEVRIAIMEAVSALNSNSLLPATFRKDSIAGALIVVSDALNAFIPEEIEQELETLMVPTYVFLGGRTYEGYTSAQIIAAAGNFARPTLASSVPTDGAADIVEDTLEAIELTFSADVLAGTGSFTLWLDDTTDSVVQTWGFGDLEIVDEVVTLALDTALPIGEYYLLWTEGAVILESNGAAIAANATATTLNFEVIAEA